jgi:hypothetical protein
MGNSAPAERPEGPPEERVIYRKRFQGYQFDFRGKITFTRFDRCEFVKCTLLFDHGTEQLAFTDCVFKDCNIDKLEPDEKCGLYVRDNFFDRPLDERRAEFEKMLTEALAARKARKKMTGRMDESDLEIVVPPVLVVAVPRAFGTPAGRRRLAWRWPMAGPTGQ